MIDLRKGQVQSLYADVAVPERIRPERPSSTFSSVSGNAKSQSSGVLISAQYVSIIPGKHQGLSLNPKP